MIDPSTPGGAVAAQVFQALPQDVQNLLTQPGKTSERIKAAIRWAARPDAGVVRRHHKRNAAIESFADIQKAKLHDMDAVAGQIARLFRQRAALTGAATGLPGGLWAVVAAGADVQLTAIYAVRMVADIAQAYGYDTSLTEEQAELADVLAVAAGVDGLRGVGTWLTRQELAHLIPDLLPKLMTRLSVRITEEQAGKWAGRLVPGLGAVVSGAIDYTFLRVAGKRAVEHYHARYVQEHGMGGRALPAPAAALPAPAQGALPAPAPTALPAPPVAQIPPPRAPMSGVAPYPAMAPAPATGPRIVDAMPPAAPPYAVPAGPGAPMARPAGPPVAPPMVVAAPSAASVVPQRSGVLAALLEVIIPGAGAFYAGRVGAALLWFLASALALVLAWPPLAGPLATLVQSGSATLPDWAPYFAGAVVLWLALRIVLAVRYAQRYAALHMNRPPERSFAAQLTTAAALALLVTCGACAALGYLAFSGITSLLH